jgi:hypothetical protein
MTSEDASPSSDVPASGALEPELASSSPKPSAHTLLKAMIISLAILGGVAAWLFGESRLDYFRPSEKAASQRFDFSGLNKEMLWVSAENGALSFGALGGFLGFAMGLAGGASRPSTKWALIGAIVGLILGVLGGALPSFAVMPYQWKHRNDDPNNADLVMPLLIHCGLWAGAGLAAGLAFGFGRHGWRPLRLADAALAGLIGAMVGILIYELGGALLFPMARTPNPFAETWSARLFARLCIAVFVALGVIFSLKATVPENKVTTA